MGLKNIHSSGRQQPSTHPIDFKTYTKIPLNYTSYFFLLEALSVDPSQLALWSSSSEVVVL
jgi:hypothetical protein